MTTLRRIDAHSEARGAPGPGESDAERAGRNTVGWNPGLAAPLAVRPGGVAPTGTAPPDEARLAAAAAVTGEWPVCACTLGTTMGAGAPPPRRLDTQSIFGVAGRNSESPDPELDAEGGPVRKPGPAARSRSTAAAAARPRPWWCPRCTRTPATRPSPPQPPPSAPPRAGRCRWAPRRRAAPQAAAPARASSPPCSARDAPHPTRRGRSEGAEGARSMMGRYFCKKIHVSPNDAKDVPALWQ